MATFNRAHLILETLESISNQSFQNWECLIIDDGSKDETSQVVQKFTVNDPRFIYLQRSRNYKKGLPGCRNKGLDKARGDFVIFFDDDDIVHPENLQTCFNLLKNKEFYFCRYEKKPFRGTKRDFEFKHIKKPVVKPFKIKELDKMVTGEIPFASCCVMWNKRCFENVRFNEELMYAEEWECYTRILSKGFSGISVEQILYYNRKHPNSNTGEFQQENPVRKKSKIKAAKLIIENLALKNLLNSRLQKFFIRLGFSLDSFKIIDLTLEKSKAGFSKKMKFKLGYIFYPVLRPLFKIKGRL